MITVKQQSRISRLRKIRDIEREWMQSHGATLVGYIDHYGSKDDPDHYGDGGELIYAADKAKLDEAQRKLDEAMAALQ